MEEKIYTIKRVRFEGKWIEYWFEEEDQFVDNGMSYHLSSKAYMFWECVEKVTIYDDVISNGIAGRKMVWEKRGFNYEPKEMLP